MAFCRSNKIRLTYGYTTVLGDLQQLFHRAQRVMVEASESVDDTPWVAARPGGVGVVAAWQALDGSRRLVASGHEGLFQIWNVDTGEPVGVPEFSDPVHDALLKLVAWRGTHGVRLASAGGWADPGMGCGERPAAGRALGRAHQLGVGAHGVGHGGRFGPAGFRGRGRHCPGMGSGDGTAGVRSLDRPRKRGPRRHELDASRRQRASGVSRRRRNNPRLESRHRRPCRHGTHGTGTRAPRRSATERQTRPVESTAGGGRRR